MQLLSPWFLLGTLAVGIPIWLHLIRREQAIRLPFSSLMFIRRIPIKSVSRQRLKYLVLLATRVLVVLLIVLAFAKPYIPRAARALSGEGGAKHVVVLLDTSMSMQYGGRWERAQAAGLEAIGKLSAQDRAQIATFNSEFRVLNLPTEDKAALQAVLQKEATATASPTTYSEAFRAVEQIAEDASLPVSVVFISDLQQSGMQGLPPNFALPAGAEFRMVNVAEESDVSNWAIEGVRSRRRIYRSRYPDRLSVQVKGFADAEASREVVFSLGQKEVQRKTVEVPASGTATAVFEGFDVPLGANAAKVEIRPSDRLSLDDTFYFTLERREPYRVLFLRESGGTDELYYIRNALAAEADSPFVVDARTPSEAVSLRLANYAMVVLSNVPGVPAALASALRSFVNQGGGLLITLGNRAPSPAVESELKDLWPAKGLEKRLLTRDGERLVMVGEFDKDHALFREWQEAGAQSLRAVEIYGYVRLDPQGPVLLRLSNGQPALVEKPYGSGRALLFASSFDNVWSDFPLHPAFVPLVHQLVKYTAQLPDDPPAYRIPSGVPLEQLARGTGEDNASRIWDVRGPDGERAVPLAEENRLDYLVLRKPGFYQVHQRNRTQWLAANPDPRESDLTPLTADDRTFLQTAAQTSAAAMTDASAEQGVKQQFLWWYLLVAALLLAAAEVYLANPYLGPKRIAISPETPVSPGTNQENSYVV